MKQHFKLTEMGKLLARFQFLKQIPRTSVLILSEIIKSICGIILSSESSKCQAFNGGDVKTSDSCGLS